MPDAGAFRGRRGATWWESPSPSSTGTSSATGTGTGTGTGTVVSAATRSSSGTVVAARVLAWLAVIAAFIALVIAVGLERIGALSVPTPLLVFGSAVVAIGAIIAATIWVKSALPIVASIALLVVPIVLGVSVASWNGGVGNRRIAPVVLDAGPYDYRLAIGQLTVDLSHAPLDGRTVSVSATTKIGELAVVVPSEAAVTIDTHVGAGQSRSSGGTATG